MVFLVYFYKVLLRQIQLNTFILWLPLYIIIKSICQHHYWLNAKCKFTLWIWNHTNVSCEMQYVSVRHMFRKNNSVLVYIFLTYGLTMFRLTPAEHLRVFWQDTRAYVKRVEVLCEISISAPYRMLEMECVPFCPQKFQLEWGWNPRPCQWTYLSSLILDSDPTESLSFALHSNLAL